MGFLKHYKWDIPISALIGVFVVWTSGLEFLLPFLVLVILEISLSFDNAVVNAVILDQLSPKWQKAFLWFGIWVAVLGMRLVFPILIVSLTAGVGFAEVIDLALFNPHLYAEKLEMAHPEIATLGGVYLGMIFLNFFLGEHESFWLGPIERALVKVGKADTVSAAIIVISLLVISSSIGGEEGNKIMFTGGVSLALYLIVQWISNLFESDDLEGGHAAGKGKPIKYGMAGVGLFTYLEVQDAAFSFDGVSGAFAITDRVLVIAAGLGIGALFVRSMTIHLVHTKQLAKFPFLENGAHWAIGALAVAILGSLYVEIPEWATGLVGVLFIVASVWSSHRFNKAQAAGEIDALEPGTESVPDPV